MTKYSTFFSSPVQLVRFDGHAANGLIPVDVNYMFSFATGAVNTITPPADAVAMYITFSGTLRYTIDGVTPATSGGTGLNLSSQLVYIKPGLTVSVAGATGAVVNIQWMGST